MIQIYPYTRHHVYVIQKYAPYWKNTVFRLYTWVCACVLSIELVSIFCVFGALLKHT